MMSMLIFYNKLDIQSWVMFACVIFSFPNILPITAQVRVLQDFGSNIIT